MVMKYLDKEGFIAINPSGFSPITEGDAYEILYQKCKSRKWWVFFFPLSASPAVYKEIEETFYKPSSNKNKGFELLPMWDIDTVIVMCYKQWMNADQLTNTVQKYMPTQPTTMRENRPSKIGDDRDIAFIQGGNPLTERMRLKFFMSVADYCGKQERGE
jgi:hypothetical protein